MAVILKQEGEMGNSVRARHIHMNFELLPIRFWQVLSFLHIIDGQLDVLGDTVPAILDNETAAGFQPLLVHMPDLIRGGERMAITIGSAEAVSNVFTSKPPSIVLRLIKKVKVLGVG